MGSNGIADLKQLLKKNAELLRVSPEPKTNDVLVHCCVEDVKWVKEHLLPHLETKLQRRCYLSYRDGTELGKDATDAINDDVNSAANLLLVISQEYLAYSWHAYYVKMAHRKSIVEDIPLVVVFLDDVRSLKFPEFCQVQPYLMHHILLQWEAKATAKKQEEFWKELSGMYLKNKNFGKHKEKRVTARQTIVSCSIPEKMEFIHSEQPIFRPKIAKKPCVSKPRSADSALLYDQIIVEVQDGGNTGQKKLLCDGGPVNPRVLNGHGPFRQGSCVDKPTDVRIAKGNNAAMVDDGEETFVGSHDDNVLRSHNRSRRNDSMSNRCDEIYLSECPIIAVDSSTTKSSVSLTRQDHNSEYVPQTGNEKEGCTFFNTENESQGVPVSEMVLEKCHTDREMACDIETLLHQLEMDEARKTSKHVSIRASMGDKKI